MLCTCIHINACSLRDFTIWSITFYHFTRNTRTNQLGCAYIIESLRVTPSDMTNEYMDGAHDAIQEEEKHTKIEFYTIECAHKYHFSLFCTHSISMLEKGFITLRTQCQMKKVTFLWAVHFLLSLLLSCLCIYNLYKCTKLSNIC